MSFRILDWVAAGVVDGDQHIKIWVLQYLVFTGFILSAVGVVVNRAPHWQLIAVGRVVLGVLVVLWLGRQTTIGTWKAVLLFGGLPAASGVVTTSVGGGASLAGRTAWAVLMPTLGGVMYGRRVAIYSAALTLSMITVTDFRYEPVARVALDLVGFAVVLVPVIYLVSETARRLRATVEQLKRTQADRDRLQHSVDDATERERAKIATELHDDTIQVMTAATMRLDMARAKHPLADGRPVELGAALELMQEAIARARRLSFDLYPPALDNGLRPALTELAARVEQNAGFAVAAEVTQQRFSAEYERLAYRTAKELLENARKHSRADLVEITVRTGDSGLVLVVADNGCGFDRRAPTALVDGHFHFGLRAAEERVRRAGGTLIIDSATGMGTTAVLRLPLTSQDSAESPPEAAHGSG